MSFLNLNYSKVSIVSHNYSKLLISPLFLLVVKLLPAIHFLSVQAHKYTYRHTTCAHVRVVFNVCVIKTIQMCSNTKMFNFD